jgi:hypothetical protein
MDWRGTARRGPVGQGAVSLWTGRVGLWRGGARTGRARCDLGRVLVWHGWARLGSARQGAAGTGYGRAWLGPDCRGSAWLGMVAARLRRGTARLGLARHGTVWSRSGLVRYGVSGRVMARKGKAHRDSGPIGPLSFCAHHPCVVSTIDLVYNRIGRKAELAPSMGERVWMRSHRRSWTT